jgi:hypothetical protein
MLVKIIIRIKKIKSSSIKKVNYESKLLYKVKQRHENKENKKILYKKSCATQINNTLISFKPFRLVRDLAKYSVQLCIQWDNIRVHKRYNITTTIERKREIPILHHACICAYNKIFLYFSLPK